MTYILKVPAYPIGRQSLKNEIDRIMIKHDFSHYIVEEGNLSNDGNSVEFKVVFTANT